MYTCSTEIICNNRWLLQDDKKCKIDEVLHIVTNGRSHKYDIMGTFNITPVCAHDNPESLAIIISFKYIIYSRIRGSTPSPFYRVFFYICLSKNLNITNTLFLNIQYVKKNVHTDRQIRDKQELVLSLFAICIKEFFSAWF